MIQTHQKFHSIWWMQSIDHDNFLNQRNDIVTTTIVKRILVTSSEIKNDRTKSDVLVHLMTEVGELAQEIQISEGKSYKSEGVDGVIGEAIDVIICALDIIKLHNTNIKEDYDLSRILEPKLDKWKKVSQ